MPLQTSGAISLEDLQTEFGGSNPIGIEEYYRGGGLVPDSTTNAGVPTSGAISLEDFYGASSAPASVSIDLTVGWDGTAIPEDTGFAASGFGFTGAPYGSVTSTNIDGDTLIRFGFVQVSGTVGTAFVFYFSGTSHTLDSVQSVDLFDRDGIPISFNQSSSGYISIYTGGNTLYQWNVIGINCWSRFDVGEVYTCTFNF